MASPISLLIAGVDEVGRGPLVGPVVAAAVILDPDNPIAGIKDSKKLSEKKRESLNALIRERALSYAIGRAEADEIDEINILQASLLAMQRAIAKLSLKPQKVLVDGNRCPAINYPVEAIIKGDQKITVIGAASIIAKVERDREMIEYENIYPGYGFAQHKGYPTKDHLKALQKLGPTPMHRRTFGPVARLLST
jgi:ribonuclease HII